MSAPDAIVDPFIAWADDDAWLRKLDSDGDWVEHVLPVELWELHEVVVDRTQQSDAQALILSGSTARGCRTEISDLDYHLVGQGIETRDLSLELDVHVLSEEKLNSDLLAGDDFVQWSLRFGSVVLDKGPVRRGLRLIAERKPWPDPQRKRAHAVKSLGLARRFVGTEDEDGALVQVRTALSLAARARLLSEGIFPLARAELPAQLDAIRCSEAARDLAVTIYGSPPLAELSAIIQRAEELLAAPVGGRATNGHVGREP